MKYETIVSKITNFIIINDINVSFRYLKQLYERIIQINSYLFMQYEYPMPDTHRHTQKEKFIK